MNIIILRENIDYFNPEKIEIRQFTSGFCRMPDALFHIPEELEIKSWKARFIVGLSYLYALSFGKGKALTTKKELMEILQTKSSSVTNAFINKVNELSNLLKAKAEKAGIPIEGGELITQKGRKGGTQCYLIDQTIIAEAFRHKVNHGGTFAFYNIALLLPISAQAKAVLLYLHRKARGGSLLDGKAEASVSARELAQILAIGTGGGRLKGYLLELEEAGIIEKTSRRKLKFRITKLDEWNREALLNILHNWKGHPFLKNWKFPIEPISPQEDCNEKSPIGRQKKSNRATKTDEKSPIGRQKKSNRATYRNKNRNKTKERNKSMEYDAIYNNGGGTKNSMESLNRRKSDNKETPSLSKPDGLNLKSDERKLDKPNIADRVDQKELEKIKEVLRVILPELKRAYPEIFTSENLKIFEELYAPALRKIYGDEWLALAVMYELFNRKAPQYGYSRKVNKNFLGLLISFALKDSSSDFWEFYKKFRRVFGLGLQKVENVGQKEQQGEQSEPGLSLSDLKEFFKRKLKDKKTIYTMFIENGIKALEKVGGKWVVRCKDSITRDYVSNNFMDFLKEFLKSENIEIEGA